MLVLTRKLNEEIQIGGGITLRIVEIGRNKVRLGIDAPPSTPIVRGEIADRDPEEVRTTIPLAQYLAKAS